MKKKFKWLVEKETAAKVKRRRIMSAFLAAFMFVSGGMFGKLAEVGFTAVAEAEEDMANPEDSPPVVEIDGELNDDSETPDELDEPTDEDYETDYDVEQEDEDGYYLIKDTDASPDKTHSAKTRYILTMAEKLTITAKADYPSITKQIKEGEELSSQNTAAIGDTVTYQLDSKVPDMTGYEKYFYIVNDSMFKGLTLTPTFTITIDGKPLTQVNEEDAATANGASFYYKDVKDTNADYDDFELVFVNFIQYEGDKGKDIVITYNAILNGNAKVGTEGNPNTVYLTFSNDPNYKYNGKPTKPDEPNEPDDGEPGDPTGKTPPSKVITYTTAIKLTKVDASTKEALKGAEFTLEGEGVNSTLKATTTYTEDPAGTFYKLTDGKYTETAPAEDGSTDASYVDTTTKYKESIEFKTVAKPFATQTELKIKDDGTLEIRGLNPGTYTLTETKAAEGGYLLKDKPAVITITADPTPEQCKWIFKCEGVENVNETDGTLSFDFTNVKGVVLPGTGAFGSKLMYALGTIFTATGAAYMISKKKSKKEEE